MTLIGLAGKSGSGKSTVAAHLEKRGAGHIDADRITHEVLESNGTVKEKLRARLGDEIFDGKHIDRGVLGRIVFGDAEALSDLNDIIHPAIIEGCRAQLEAYTKAGLDLVVVDAALLLEVPLPFSFDLMIGLRCGREELVRRLQSTGGLSDAAIHSRLDAQTHIDGGLDAADVVVDASRPIEEVLTEVDRLVDGVTE
ncbi:MAG: dephospho-CoA kinase [bacterium]|nr:dephospho-CoA kinase [bacterium]